ncbi:DUF7344 domain-containing protein [Halomarina oriensis]|uniref:DUF7344 domain-containing protein n=1 Tax=Halomarina oriensis TaxID=671145 RepID=A0A6B0GPR7_9EURY|nr:hypothetical protein [Halomarina oriensis]MWG34095.1 hypothetical protein [Halomarina oriensis]
MMRHRPLNVSDAKTTDLLRTELRRQVVTFLLETEATYSLDELAGHLVRLDTAAPPEHTDEKRHTERVATRLYHSAIPRLAAADVVVFDADERTVTPGPQLSTLGSHLDSMLGLQSPLDGSAASTSPS